MSDWQDVINLLKLTQLNLRVAMKYLEDTVYACTLAREKLEEALRISKEAS